MNFTRRSLSLALAGLAGAPAVAAFAQDEGEGLASARTDMGGRLTLPVTINGHGPLHFAVDSAANASVIATDLVEFLGLTPGGEVEINTLIDRERAQSVWASSLQTGAIDTANARLVLASREGLGGVDGLIGTDLLAAYRLVMSFRGRRIFVAKSRYDGGGLFDEGRSAVRYRPPVEQRFTNLMMIDAQAGGVACKVIIDTGAQITIVNRALATAARARPLTLSNGDRTQVVQSPTGRSQIAEVMRVPVMGFGGISFRRVPVLVGDFHTFRLWGLEDQPAILLGVDVLGLFNRVTIDLRRSELIVQV